MQNPDLTLHASQVRDWYGSEDGLDLRALDADCAALEAAVGGDGGRADGCRTTNSARCRRRGRAAARTLSREFLRRHGEASASAAAAAVRTPPTRWPPCATTCGTPSTGRSPRPWRSTTAHERPEWLAAAHTVTTGAGDRAAASELIDQQVKPFVDNDIRG